MALLHWPRLLGAGLLLLQVRGGQRFCSGRPDWLCAVDRLPDFDCLGDLRAERILVLASELMTLLDQLGSVGETESVELGQAFVPKLWWHEVIYADEILLKECPFSVPLLRILRWAACFVASWDHPQCKQRIRDGLTDALFEHPYELTAGEAFPIFVNTRFSDKIWPILFKLHTSLTKKADLRDPGASLRVAYQCTGRKSEVSWDEYLHLFATHPREQINWIDLRGATSFENAIKRGGQDWESRVLQCPMGVLISLMEKVVLAETMFTEGYPDFAAELVRLLDVVDNLVRQSSEHLSSLDLFFLTSWPFWDKLLHIYEQATGRRIMYALDFHPWEILQPSEGPAPEELRGLPAERHLAELRSRLRRRPSPAYRGLLLALQESSAARLPSDAAKLVFFTLLWGGERLARHLPSVFERARAFGYERRYIVFCGGPAYDSCLAAHPFPALCIRMQQLALFNKHAMLAAIVNSGFDAIYLDYDTVMFKDPLPGILKLAEDHEILVSRDFASECLNTGVIYAKAHSDTSAFFDHVLVWMWHHPFEFTQKAFSGLLGAQRLTPPRGAATAQEEIAKQPSPRWTILDPINEYVTSVVYSFHSSAKSSSHEGWTGEISNIVVFHFLDGGGGVDPNKAVRGEYKDLFEVFLTNPKLNLSDPLTPLYEQDPELREEVLWSRHDRLPAELLKCQMTSLSYD